VKLHYFRDAGGLRNFGDDLNEWLWPRLIPDLLDDDEGVTLVGIGTLLNDTIHQRLSPVCRRVVVFSTGVGYGRAAPNLDDSWKIYCVRGPLSARALGVPEDLAVTDGAALLRRVYSPTVTKSHRFSYMPHAVHARAAAGAWEEVCEEIGFGYVDPRWPVEKVLAAISSTESLLTEAMHGAIVADALRVPWIPMDSTGRFPALPFKWQDWCMSVDVSYRPKRIPSLWAAPKGGTRSGSVRHWMKQKIIAADLLRIAVTTRPSLSSTSRIDQLADALEASLFQLRKDMAAADRAGGIPAIRL
jgi:succinoglycan biosynthesis protein ExoV